MWWPVKLITNWAGVQQHPTGFISILSTLVLIFFFLVFIVIQVSDFKTLIPPPAHENTRIICKHLFNNQRLENINLNQEELKKKTPLAKIKRLLRSTLVEDCSYPQTSLPFYFKILNLQIMKTGARAKLTFFRGKIVYYIRHNRRCNKISLSLKCLC